MKRLLSILIAALLLSPVVLLAQQFAVSGFTLLASTTQTASTVSTSDCCGSDYNWSAIHAIINVSNYTAGQYTPKIQGKDPATGNYYDILIGPSFPGAFTPATTGSMVLKIGPGLAASANASAMDFLPKTWRMTFSGASSPNMTFSVGINPGEGQ